MSRSLQLNLPPTLVEPVSREREMSRPESGEKVSLTTLLAESCAAVGLQEKQAGLHQGYDPKYWPRVKSGEKRAYLDPVANLPEPAQREFVKRYAQQLKMRVSTETEERAALADLAEAAVRALRTIA